PTAGGATRKRRVGRVLKSEGASHAAHAVLGSAPVAAPPIPFSNYPEEKNRRKKRQQINRGQGGKANANHGVAVGARAGCGRAMSLPHTIVAVPHARNESGLPAFAVF